MKSAPDLTTIESAADTAYLTSIDSTLAGLLALASVCAVLLARGFL